MLCLWIEGNDSVLKTLPYYCRGKEQPLWKTLFLFIDKWHCHENSLLNILFFMINDLVIKLFCVLRLTPLGIQLSVVSTILLFVQIFYACMIAHGILIGSAYTYIYTYIIIEKDSPRHAKRVYTTLLCNLFIYYID